MSGLPKLDTPSYQLTIPSTGNTISYRPYLVKEEKILMMAIESNDANQMMNAVKDVIRSCTNDSVDVDSLAMFDLEYIFTQLRSKSVGESATIKLKCEECDESNEVEINLDETYVDTPDAETKVISLTDTIGVSLRYPSVNNLMKAQAIKVTSEVDRMFELIIKCIDSIYSGDQVFDATEQSDKELRDFIESLSSKQFNEIREFVEAIPSATIDVSFNCVSCSHKNEFNVKGLANFFG